MKQTFSLNRRIHGIHLSEKVKKQHYWQGPASAGRLILTNHNDLQLEIQASSKNTKNIESSTKTLVFPIIKDLQVFSGTRLLASDFASEDHS